MKLLNKRTKEAAQRYKGKKKEDISQVFHQGRLSYIASSVPCHSFCFCPLGDVLAWDSATVVKLFQLCELQKCLISPKEKRLSLKLNRLLSFLQTDWPLISSAREWRSAFLSISLTLRSQSLSSLEGVQLGTQSANSASPYPGNKIKPHIFSLTIWERKSISVTAIVKKFIPTSIVEFKSNFMLWM